LELPVREIHVNLPVGEGQVVLALPDVVVGAVAVEGLADVWHGRRAERPAAEEAVDQGGVDDGDELTAMIHPEVRCGGRYNDRA
jgi:hypothetical protein